MNVRNPKIKNVQNATIVTAVIVSMMSLTKRIKKEKSIIFLNGSVIFFMLIIEGH